MAALAEVSRGWEVIAPFNWSSDIASVLQAGFNPVFVDIDPWHFGMDTQEVLAALNEANTSGFPDSCPRLQCPDG